MGSARQRGRSHPRTQSCQENGGELVRAEIASDGKIVLVLNKDS